MEEAALVNKQQKRARELQVTMNNKSNVFYYVVCTTCTIYCLKQNELIFPSHVQSGKSSAPIMYFILGHIERIQTTWPEPSKRRKMVRNLENMMHKIDWRARDI